MKVTGILIFVLALVIGILPLFTECAATGREPLKLANGNTVPMKCHWTAIAEITLAIPLAALGGMLAFSKRKETGISLSVLGALLGVFVVLIPTTLIGVCASNMMLCNMLMSPALVLAGILVVAASVTQLVISYRAPEQAA
jgi:hypothetical protein